MLLLSFELSFLFPQLSPWHGVIQENENSELRSRLYTTNGYKQGHPCMPADVFRMLICGSSNSGKKCILLHMLYELLGFEKVYLFSKNLQQNKYLAFWQDFAANIDPVVGFEEIEVPGDKIIPLEDLPVDNQNIVVFDDLVCGSNQNSIINYSINERHRNAASSIALRLTTMCPKTSKTTAAIFAFAIFFREKTSESLTSWGSITAYWTAPATKNTLSSIMTNRRN